MDFSNIQLFSCAILLVRFMGLVFFFFFLFAFHCFLVLFFSLMLIIGLEEFFCV